MKKIGILGATGMVGQQFIRLLEQDSEYIVYKLGASEKSAGKRFGTLVPINSKCDDFIIVSCKVANFVHCDIIFSALDSSVAGPIEKEFAMAGFPVFSTSKNWRMHSVVPLCVPYCNPDHLKLVEYQKKQWKCDGFIVTNANCSTTGIVIVLKALMEVLTPIKLTVHTMQAVSGAGYPGLSVIDIHDNVIPFIDGEEDKIETETLKILGKLNNDSIDAIELDVMAFCNRVSVLNGHTINMLVECHDAISLDKIKSYLHSKEFIRVLEDPKRPQPRIDREFTMKVSIGRFQLKKPNMLSFCIVTHNTVLGAAGSSIWNSKEAIKMNLL